MYINNPKLNKNPLVDREHINVPVVTSYTSRTAKREGYELRMQYHSKLCIAAGGKMFNTTLTYADHALHKFYGYNVPSYDDLRWLLHDSTFTEHLKRDFGVEHYDYFIGTELGEGKGVRGYHNNPHYHVIWFMFPGDSEKFKRLDDKTFLSLVRSYWQGTYYTYNGVRYSYADMMLQYNDSYAFQYALKHPRIYTGKQCVKGIVSCGRYGCAINGAFGMNTYVCKYACKDATAIDRENKIYYKAYEAKEKEIADLAVDKEAKIQMCEVFARSELRYFRAHHSTRARLSHHLGENMVDYIKDPLNPVVDYETSKGVQQKGIPQYIFRKIYRTLDSNKCYQKNEKGLALQDAQIEARCDRLFNRVYTSYSFMKETDFAGFIGRSRRMDAILEGLTLDTGVLDEHFKTALTTTNWDANVFTCYAVYKTYYEGLMFDARYFTGCLEPLNDYYESTYENYRFDLQESELVPYSTLYTFSQYISEFLMLDDILESKAYIMDVQNKAKAAEKDRLRRKFNDCTVFAKIANDFDECKSHEMVA